MISSGLNECVSCYIAARILMFEVSCGMIAYEPPSCLCTPLVNTSASYPYYSCTVLMNMTCAVELTMCLPYGSLSIMKLCGTSGPFVSNGMSATFTNTEYTDVHFVCVDCALVVPEQ
jgi:hypothetical protein